METAGQLPTTIQERLAKAQSLKEEGNGFFRAKQWKKAIRKYHHTLMYCKGITDKLDFIPGMAQAAAGELRATDEEERQATVMTLAVTNNLAGRKFYRSCFVDHLLITTLSLVILVGTLQLDPAYPFIRTPNRQN